MTSCTQCLALERIVLNGEERRATCSECGAVVERVQRRASTASARVLLAALGHELPGLTGRAVAYGERVAPPTPEDADAAAARAERRRTHAVEALRRLAGLWQRGERASVRALWLTFVRRGEDARIREGAGKPGGWEERLGWLLLEREERLSALLHQRRKGSGADAAAARQRGYRLLAEAEALFDAAEPVPSGGTWLDEVRDWADRVEAQCERDVRAAATQRKARAA